MKLTIISPGKFSDNSQKQIFYEYAKRLRWKIELKELNIKVSTSMNLEQIKIFEANQISKNLSSSSYIIALDEKGSQITSIDFADLIKTASKISSNIDLVIGGAYGLSEEIKKRSNYQLSLGKMTYPHLMVRMLLIEQIYRAQTIIDGHPYHKQ